MDLHIQKEHGTTGYTIKNTTTNDEFVWVPCTLTATIETVAFARVLPTTPIGDENYEDDPNYMYNCWELHDFIDQAGAKADKIRESVGKYGGFYIAKYEASSSDGTQNGTARSLPNATPWVNITRADAITKAEAMVNTADGIKSALISGECWDTTLQWMVNKSDNKTQNAGYDIDSTGKGYYDKSDKTTTASSTAYAVNNIYDMAGNVWEWTTENCEDVGYGSLVSRGGYVGSGSDLPAAYRDYGDDDAYDDVGFRCVLYK